MPVFCLHIFVCILAGNRLNSRSICVREVDNRTSIRKNRTYFLKIIGRHKHRAMFKAYKSCFQIVVITEYVKQRALGYEPRTVPPDALFACLERLGELADRAGSPELDEDIHAVLKQIAAEFLLPGKG